MDEQEAASAVVTVTVAVRFPTGRYHATPWGRAVNEGAVEWPPSPWRLLRALHATWQWRAPDEPVEAVEAAMHALAPAPSYLLPRHVVAHTRHYYPDTAYGPERSTDKVFDPFAALDPAGEVVIRWPSELDAPGRQALSRLLRALPYVGRADSLCSARLVDPVDEALPAEGWLDPGDVGTLADPGVRVLSPTLPLDLDALLTTTARVRRAGQVTPAGSRWISYRTPEPAVRKAVVTARHRSAPSADTVLLSLASPAPPSVRLAVAYGDRARSAALSAADGQMTTTLSGRQGTAVRRTDHVHAHYLPLDLDGDGRLDAVVVWAPEGLSNDDVARLQRIRRLSSNEPGLRAVRAAVTAVGPAARVLPASHVGPSSLWQSASPFVPTRHQKKGADLQEFLHSEVSRELVTRGLPDVVGIELVRGDWLGFRRRRRLRDPERRGYGLRITTERHFSGPLALGELSHFGLGLFTAAA